MSTALAEFQFNAEIALALGGLIVVSFAAFAAATVAIIVAVKGGTKAEAAKAAAETSKDVIKAAVDASTQRMNGLSQHVLAARSESASALAASNPSVVAALRGQGGIGVIVSTREPLNSQAPATSSEGTSTEVVTHTPVPTAPKQQETPP